MASPASPGANLVNDAPQNIVSPRTVVRGLLDVEPRVLTRGGVTMTDPDAAKTNGIPRYETSSTRPEAPRTDYVRVETTPAPTLAETPRSPSPLLASQSSTSELAQFNTVAETTAAPAYHVRVHMGPEGAAIDRDDLEDLITVILRDGARRHGLEI